MKIRWSASAVILCLLIGLGAGAPGSALGREFERSNDVGCPVFLGDPTGGVIGIDGGSSGGGCVNPPNHQSQGRSYVPRLVVFTNDIPILIGLYPALVPTTGFPTLTFCKHLMIGNRR